jgi:hypothetical protein
MEVASTTFSIRRETDLATTSGRFSIDLERSSLLFSVG